MSISSLLRSIISFFPLKTVSKSEVELGSLRHFYNDLLSVVKLFPNLKLIESNLLSLASQMFLTICIISSLNANKKTLYSLHPSLY